MQLLLKECTHLLLLEYSPRYSLNTPMPQKVISRYIIHTCMFSIDLSSKEKEKNYRRHHDMQIIADRGGKQYRDIGSLEQLCLSIAFENQMRVCKITMIRTLAYRQLVKFAYSEKATRFCNISTLLLSTVQDSKREISQNFLAFSEYLNFSQQLTGGWQR